MAVHYTDLLARILEDKTASHRRDLWLWFWLTGHGANLGSYAESRMGMRDKMAHYLDQNPWLTPRAIDDKNKQLLPERQLDWLNEGSRQIEWVYQKFTQYAGYNWAAAKTECNT
ncbi:hypothetical protein [Pseudomonas lactis]|uniref:hypothetical protein n=1 Tax=Pseudomonas lactis TaxID=1615674 RepID=UPI0018648FD2|nr:hypothetical protein [Pseudomonas lactis]